MIVDLIDALRLCLIIVAPWLLVPAAVALIHYEAPPIRLAHLITWIRQVFPDLAAHETPRALFDTVLVAEETTVESAFALAPAWVHPILPLIALLPAVWIISRITVAGRPYSAPPTLRPLRRL